MPMLPIQVAIYCMRQNRGKREFLMLHRVLKGRAFWHGVTGGVESDDPVYHTAALPELNILQKSRTRISVSLNSRIDIVRFVRFPG